MPRGRLVSPGEAQSYQPPEIPKTFGNRADEPQARIEEAVRAGYAEGLQRGRADARAELEAERARLAAQLAARLETLHATEREMVEAGKTRLIELALLIAGRLLRERLDAGDPVIARIADEVLIDAPQSGVRTLRVNPADHHALLDIQPRLGEPGSLVIVPDPAVTRGGLIVEATNEMVDARLETALAAIRDALADTP